jgi:ribonucleoside-diphosphate reductase alpha chain
MLARRLFEETRDVRLGAALGYLFERVARNEDGGVQPTYDLSVPDNVTYVANGMVSHNTIGLMMDCDTTGVEPDLALVKFKKLVGGGSMQIVNQTVPRALKNLGYQPEQVEAITEYIAEHGHVVDAPGLRPEHYEVFDCAMGERAISPMGHVRMMATVQPGLSGAISKTVNMPENATIDDVEKIYFEGWKLGLKALAIYRDNCKVGQPLSDARKKPEKAPDKAEAPAPGHEVRPVRRRLPRQRPASVTRFSVAGAEGYMTVSKYPDDGVGEVFLKLGKQGSTLAGVMDAFSMAISISLQYGVPLEKWVEKFTNMRFEPAGVTDDPDIRIASSVMDYVFRRLALDHLPYETRSELSILSATERAAQLAGEDPGAITEDMDPAEMAQSAPRELPHPDRPVRQEHATGQEQAGRAGQQARPGEQEGSPQNGQPAAQPHSSIELLESQQGRTADAPLCLICGTKMRPAGSCYVCEGCGATSGCS